MHVLVSPCCEWRERAERNLGKKYFPTCETSILLFFSTEGKNLNFLSYEIFFIPVITSGLITRIRFYETRKQDGEWERESRQQLTQYPRCNPTSVSWASPVGDDELHTRENKTKWNGGGRWADIVTQSNTRNQTVPRPRCLESNTRHSTVLYALCYDVSNL